MEGDRIDVGSAAELSETAVRMVTAGRTKATRGSRQTHQLDVRMQI